MNLYNKDYKEVLNNAPKESVDMIFTDPPYKTTKRGNSGGTGGMLKDKNFINGNGGFANNDVIHTDWLKKCYDVLKEKGHIYVMTNNKNLKQMLIDVESVGFKVFKTLIWVKNTAITNMWYMDNHEYIIFARKGRAKKINNNGDKSTLLYDNPKNKLHPSEKPIKMIEQLILNSSNENDVILDPFMGSNSTGMACKNTNRKFIGIELDKSYFSIAKKRVEEKRKEKENEQQTLFGDTN